MVAAASSVALQLDWRQESVAAWNLVEVQTHVRLVLCDRKVNGCLRDNARGTPTHMVPQPDAAAAVDEQFNTQGGTLDAGLVREAEAELLCACTQSNGDAATNARMSLENIFENWVS